MIWKLVVLLLINSHKCSFGRKENESVSIVDRTRPARFVSVVSGYYTGYIYRNGVVPVTKTVLPVEASAFYPNVAFYLEESEGDGSYLRQVFVLSESGDGLLHATPYNFTESEYIRDDNGDIDVSVFQRLQSSDYSTLPHCDMVITEIDNVYISNWPECDSIKVKLTPTYFTVWGCIAAGFTHYENPQLETESIYPAIVTKHLRFPLLPYMLEAAQSLIDPCV